MDKKLSSCNCVPLSVLDYAVLSCVRDNNGTAYGMQIMEDLSRIYHYKTGYGSVYASLQRLSKWNFTESSMADPTDVRGGKAVRQFLITSSGNAALDTTRHHLEQILNPPKRERRKIQRDIRLGPFTPVAVPG